MHKYCFYSWAKSGPLTFDWILICRNLGKWVRTKQLRVKLGNSRTLSLQRYAAEGLTELNHSEQLIPAFELWGIFTDSLNLKLGLDLDKSL